MMKDMTGLRFGRLTVLERAPQTKRSGISWVCRCDCGNIAVVHGTELRRGETKSCGCLHSETVSNQMRTHGHTIGGRERLYGVWAAMITRTTNPNADNYAWYGGRGIKVCDEWRDYASFREWAYNAGYDENAAYGQCTLDRIDDDGDYSPGNCRWVPMLTQANNQRSNIRITVRGETHNLKEWANITGLNYTTLRRHNKLGKAADTIANALN